MKTHGLRRSPLIAASLCLALAACGGDSETPSDGKDAGGMPPDNTAGEGEPQAGNSGGGSGGGAGEAAADGGMEFDASQDAGEYVPDPEFEGIPNGSVMFGAEVDGCLERSGGESDTLVLTFGRTASTVQLAAKDGMVTVNGLKCFALPKPRNIQVVGGAAADTLIVDFSVGEFPASLREGAISIDLAAGKDTIAVAGTRDMDQIVLGTDAGASVLRVGTEPKLVMKNQESLIVSAGPGDDQIDATGGSLGAPLAIGFIAYAGAGFDMISGGAGPDELHGGEEDDLFKTGETADGADIYDGGRGTDTLTYELRKLPVIVKVDRVANDGEANERDNVQDTIETLIGGLAADTLQGGDADNTLIGGPGNDTLNGGNGDDRFLEPNSAQGSDIMNGGAGFDFVDYGERRNDVKVTMCIAAQVACVTGACGCTADDGEAGEKDNLVNIEGAFTGAGNDQLFGSSADNYFSAGAGNDELRGEAGDDTLYGDDGNDILIGGPGEDLLDGDHGEDLFDAGDGQGDICVLSRTETPRGCELY